MSLITTSLFNNTYSEVISDIPCHQKHSHKKRKDSLETLAKPAVFFFITWVSKIIRTQSTQDGMKYKYKQWRKFYQFKVKGLTSCFIPSLKMSGENCLILNCYSFRTASGISFFRTPTKNDDKIKLEEQHCCSYYSCRWRFEKANLKPNIPYL